jgi:hypothetical protein
MQNLGIIDPENLTEQIHRHREDTIHILIEQSRLSQFSYRGLLRQGVRKNPAQLCAVNRR